MQAGRIQLKDLELHRAAEYLTRKQHSDPVTGMAIALLDALMVRNVPAFLPSRARNSD